tara:strand:+ start:1293 stop:2282 length:990 start_codon:yes stop_codon:yes gene_type:complete
MNKQTQSLINNKINVESKKYTLIIGSNPSSGARSPILWNKVYKKLHINCRMYPADIYKKNLSKFFVQVKNDKNFIGSSVTIPYKEECLKYLDEIDPGAKKIGSINTIKKRGKKLIGFNTDYLACKLSLKQFKNKKEILILGAGGVGKAAIISASEIFKSAKINIYNRTQKKANRIKNKLKNNRIKVLKNFKEIFNMKNVDLLINSTSVGFKMWQKKGKGYFNLYYFSPIGDLKKLNLVKSINLNSFYKKNLTNIKKNKFSTLNFFKENKNCEVFDLIYDPKKTSLINTANQFFKKNINGLTMNLDQAIYAFSIVNNFKKRQIIKKIMSN